MFEPVPLLNGPEVDGQERASAAACKRATRTAAVSASEQQQDPGCQESFPPFDVEGGMLRMFSRDRGGKAGEVIGVDPSVLTRSAE